MPPNLPPNLIDTFLHEADDLLAEIEETALRMDPAQPDGELVHQLFRAFHTVKGSGGLVGLTEVASFTHHLETLLDALREGAMPVSAELVGIVLASKDQIRAMLTSRQNGEVAPAGEAANLVAQIQALSGSATPGPQAASAPRPTPNLAPRSAERSFSIRFKPASNMLASGGNPVALFRDLKQLGKCEIVAHADCIPPLDRLEPDSCYLWWTISLSGATDENAIRDVFLFVKDGSEIEKKGWRRSQSPPRGRL